MDEHEEKKGILAALGRLEHAVEDLGRRAAHSPALEHVAAGGGLIALEAVVFMGMSKIGIDRGEVSEVAIEAAHLATEILG